MKLTYVFHSGFVLEMEKIVLIIDYFKDSGSLGTGAVSKLLKECKKKIYVLSSHIHKDHYNPEILKWQEENPEISYIFSKDIFEETGINRPSIHYIDKLEEYSDEKLNVKAYGSTDEGVSFYIQADGKSIFHAGDLNNWHWNEEAGEDESKGYEDRFHEELALLAKDVKSLNLAMFPVDPRLGKDYMRGPKEFIDAIATAIFVPMHFGGKYDSANEFRPVAEEAGCQFIEIHKKGQVFDLQ